MIRREAEIDLRGAGVAEWLSRHFDDRLQPFVGMGEAQLMLVGANEIHGHVRFHLLGRGDGEYVNNAEVMQAMFEQLSALPDSELFAEAEMNIASRSRAMFA